MTSTATASDTGRDAPRDLENQREGHDGPSRQPNSPFQAGRALGRRLLSLLAVEDGEVYEAHPDKHPKWYQKLLDAGVEENGIKPVPVHQRTSTQYNNLFTVFFTCLLGLLPYGTPFPPPAPASLSPTPSDPHTNTHWWLFEPDADSVLVTPSLTESPPACWPRSAWA